ncbi:hypothetical protein H072_662 [Dactylellina haptotyla CBS 200.50]|uniref:Uncharacterized protein n=1 Tax=Dactylellina haptotyla (strain CBS 200.50) TaxID=1284197 RepID=S8AWP6_DACHA|nr:hypothetical protein H072_662 [Dactylellina haptotyla CBS 200.50]
MGVNTSDRPFTFDDVDFGHELDDYINSFTYADNPSLFFEEAFYNAQPGLENQYLPTKIEIPDSDIDPLLRGIPTQPDPVNAYAPLQDLTLIQPQFEPQISDTWQASSIVAEPKVAPSTACQYPSRKLLRKSKKDESTYDHSVQARYPPFDPRLYEYARRCSASFKCPPPPTATQNLGYNTQIVAAPGLLPDSSQATTQRASNPNISQLDIDNFLASINPDFLNFNGDNILGIEDCPDVIETYQAPQPPNPSVINQKEFTFRMLAPSALPIQPSEKRKRGRPKKDEVEESHQDVSTQTVQPFVPFQAPIEASIVFSSPQTSFYPSKPVVPYQQFYTQHLPPIPTAPLLPASLPPTPGPVPFTPQSANFGDEDEENECPKRRRLGSNGIYRSMSRKEQAYLEMDKKVKLYDASNIHELLYFPNLRPGRKPCFWIQRHPYANTRIYEDHYRTWCRYRHCRGVETNELIRTANGELREKNYKHPRTIIAGNYQVAVDWEHVENEISTFKHDPEGQYEYDKRNVYDTIECFFHLRCFEQLTDFTGLVRQHLVKVDHRVLNKDKSRNKITKRKNKGGTNAAEIEWYLKDDAEQWMEMVKMNWEFNPLAGSDESLERVLLTGKKKYNERKGTTKSGFEGTPVVSPRSDF